jgi:hypothetical protein
VRAHDGRVDVASRPGRGSSFTVRIPLGERAPAHRHRPAPELWRARAGDMRPASRPAVAREHRSAPAAR